MSNYNNQSQWDDWDKITSAATYDTDSLSDDEPLSRTNAQKQAKFDEIKRKQRHLAVRLNRTIALLIGLIIVVLLILRFVNF